MKRIVSTAFSLFVLLLFLVPVGVQAAYDCSAGVHKYVQVSHTTATETADGLDLFRCELCGEEYETVLPASLHRFGEWIIEKQPDCTHPGQRYRVCETTKIPHRETRQIPALGHDYKLTEAPPSCEIAGTKTYVCSRCKDTYTESGVAALGHDYKAEITKKPSCTEDGEKTFICSHDDSESYTEPISATGHELSGWTVALPAKEGEPGKEVRTCKHCEYREEREISALLAVPEKTPLFNELDAALLSFDIIVIILGLFTIYPGLAAIHRVKKLWKQYLATKKPGGKGGVL